MKILVGAKVGNENSGNFGHAGRPGQVGGSAPSSHSIVRAKYSNPADLPTVIKCSSHQGHFGRGDADKFNLPGTDDEDRYLKSIIHDQGFDGLPDVLTEAEMDQHIKDSGEVVIYRGVQFKTNEEAAQAQADFKTGDFYVGRGIRGDGMYATTFDNEANGYLSTKRGALIQRMTIKADARVISHTDLRDLMEKHPAPEVAQQDPGRYAAAHGYDAISVHIHDTTSHYVILNRTALRVQDTNHYPRFAKEFKKKLDAIRATIVR